MCRGSGQNLASSLVRPAGVFPGLRVIHHPHNGRKLRSHRVKEEVYGYQWAGTRQRRYEFTPNKNPKLLPEAPITLEWETSQDGMTSAAEQRLAVGQDRLPDTVDVNTVLPKSCIVKMSLSLVLKVEPTKDFNLLPSSIMSPNVLQAFRVWMTSHNQYSNNKHAFHKC